LLDYVVNLLFRCWHKRLTRPVTPVRKGLGHCETYVACLDCGKQFRYDTREMRVGEPMAVEPIWRGPAPPEILGSTDTNRSVRTSQR
jgi:hypothetical protein